MGKSAEACFKKGLDAYTVAVTDEEIAQSEAMMVESLAWLKTPQMLSAAVVLISQISPGENPDLSQKIVESIKENKTLSQQITRFVDKWEARAEKHSHNDLWRGNKDNLCQPERRQNLEAYLQQAGRKNNVPHAFVA